MNHVITTATCLASLRPAYARNGNRVFVEEGKVKMDIVADTLSIDEAKELTLRAIDLEYSLS